MVHSKRMNRLHQKRMNDLVFVMYNLKLRQRHMNRQAIVNPLCLDDVPSDDEWITERETLTLPRERNWLSVLDRNARHGCDSDEDKVEALARNLEQACHDHIGGEHDEVHEVMMMLWIKTWMLEGILIMTLKMLLLVKTLRSWMAPWVVMMMMMMQQ
ncbi:uncharacterized protein LOC114261595 [Camellia sinensis]|uniref:uncharacterized protein LOC114261595 n=1 Tax=Camellia sinensis TaxID=4442 RepID=UPI0010355715|nr:uncharacterized protein LOC114261595 [Camellia sinensis]